MNTDEFSTDAAATGGITGSQPAGARSPGRRRRPRRLWRRAVAGAAVATASLAALTAGTAAAHAATLPNSPTVQLGSYMIPSTARRDPRRGCPADHPGHPGEPHRAVHDPERVGIHHGAQSQGRLLGLGHPGRERTSNYATPGILAGQIWRFQLVGYIDLNTTAAQRPTQTTACTACLQKLPVYKIINYHPDGTHTCLDGSGNPGNPTSGTMIDSYGCDPYQFNQTNQLWIIAATGN